MKRLCVRGLVCLGIIFSFLGSSSGAEDGRWVPLFGVNLGSDVVKVVKDPFRPWLYALDRVNGDVLFVDLEHRKVAKRLHLGGSPSGCDIDEGGRYLYVGHGVDDGSFRMVRIDLETQSVVASLVLPSSVYAVENVTCGSGSTVFYNAGYKSWNQGMARRMNGASGEDLGALARIKSPMVLSPDGGKLYGQYVYYGNLGEMGVWDVTKSPAPKTDHYRYAPYSANYGWAYNNYSISEDGSRLALGKLLFNPDNLAEQYGEFPELVYALDGDGGVAFGKTTIWDTTTFAEKGEATKLAALPFPATIVDFGGEKGRYYAFNPADQTLQVIGAPYEMELLFRLPEGVSESAGTIMGEVFVNVATESNLVVKLVSDDPSRVEVESEAIIPAGKTNAVFDLYVRDDAALNGTRRVVLTASATNHLDGTAMLSVYDDETATLTLSLPQTTFEGAGTLAGALMIDPVPDEDVTIELVSNNPSKIAGRSVVIPAGESMVSFVLDVFDDNLIDGMQTATISAQVQNWTGGQASVFVFDNETTAINLQLPASAMEGDGVLTNAGKVVLSGIATTDLNVSLSSADTSEILVPAYVTVSNGQSSAQFDITVLDDMDADGVQSVSISAQIPGFVPGVDSIDVQDNDLYGFSIEGIPTNQPVLEAVPVNIAAVNIDNMPLTWFTGTVSLVASGDEGSVDLSPTTTTNFVAGQWSGDVIFSNVANNVVLVADDGAGHPGTSTVFNVTGSLMVVTPDSLTDTKVVAGESLVRTMVVSNEGNTDLEFFIRGAGEGSKDPSLIAYYPFNGNADDETGNGHDGTVSGATLTTDRFGNADSAYDFNGSSSLINCGNIMNGFSNFTVSAWVNIDRFTHADYMGPWGQQRFVYGKINCNYSMFTATDTSTGCFGTSMRWADGTLLNSRAKYVVPKNEWHLITQTYDGNEVRQYDNGELINVTESAGHIMSNSLDFVIGKTAGYPGYLVTVYFDGKIDDLRIYNRALSESEITALYQEDDEGGEADDGLIASYLFNGNADDESGNGHDGTVNGATLTADRFGNIAGAYLFDGKDDYIEVPDSTDLRLANTDFSIATWFNETERNPSYHDALITKRANGYQNGWFHSIVGNSLSESGKLYYQVSGGNDPRVYSSSLVSLDEWHYSVVTYDLDSKTLRFYIDGVLDSEHVNIPSPNAATTANMIIGRDSASTSYDFHGAIDEIRIYNRMLSATEIQELYQATDEPEESWLTVDPKSGTVPPESSVSVSVRFDATGLAVGDTLDGMLVVRGNDVFTPSNAVPASMTVISEEEVDRDGDLMPDSWEEQYFGSAENGDPDADNDGDGQNNLEEYIAGMDPTNATSVFMVQTFDSPSPDEFILSWDAVTGRVYSISWKTNLFDAFQTLETNIYYPQNSYTDRVHNAEAQGFYKIDVGLE